MTVLVILDESDAGELLTLQRAAFVTEAQAYDNPHIRPLTESLDDVRAGLRAGGVITYGLRDERGRLVGAARLRVEGPAAHLGRLVVAPDRQGEGLGGELLSAAERLAPTG